ncbi:MAG: matrixin family metalloprotease [Burkholderiales bacterium]|nr:matrixin family metalloprotease [Burkholderiales bacterium]
MKENIILLRLRFYRSIAAVTSSLGLVPLVTGFSAQPTTLEDLAGVAQCVVEGHVAASEAQAVGVGIVTSYVLRDATAHGDCGAVRDDWRFEMVGGALPSGERLAIAGIRAPVPGDRVVVLLKQSPPWPDGRVRWLPVEGPQGVFRALPAVTASSTAAVVTIADAAGTSLGRVAGVAASGAGAFAKRTVSSMERKIRQTDAAAATQWKFSEDVELSEFVSTLAAMVTGTTPESRSAAFESLAARGRRPPSETQWPVGQPEQIEQYRQMREIDCSTRPDSASSVQASVTPCVGTLRPSSTVAPAMVDRAKYNLLDNGDQLWNPYPASFGSLYQLDTALMAEWNRYADHFRWGAPTGSWGRNSRNDMGGFPTSAQLVGIYGAGTDWGASTLGVTINHTFCAETTTEYFLGIPIRTYCSRYSHESDVFLNPNKSFTLSDYDVRYGITSFSTYSVREVLHHELGHAFGLDHSNEPALMQPYVNQLGWLAWPDDVAGARAKWSGQARYVRSVVLRAVQLYTPAQNGGSRWGIGNAHPYRVGQNIRLPSYVLNNFNNAAEINFTVEWYLTDAPGTFAGSYHYLGTVTHGTVNPGLNQIAAGQLLPLPVGVTGTWYVTAYLRNAGESSGTIDGYPDPVVLVYVDDHGDSAIASTMLQPNGSIAGVIGVIGDADWFGVTTPSSGTLTIRSTGSTDVAATLYAADGTTVLAYNDDDPAPNFRVSRVLAAGTYFLKVNHYANSNVGVYGVISQFVPLGCSLSLSIPPSPPFATDAGRAIVQLMQGRSPGDLGLLDDAADRAGLFLADRVWDIDGDGFVTPDRDGVILLRALLGFAGSAVTQGVPTAGATRTSWMATSAPTSANSIRLYLNQVCGGAF